MKLVLRALSLAVAITSLSTATTAFSQTLAERYPGDVGIASDPAVVFAESFEEATLNEVFLRWSDVSNGAGMSFDADTPALSSGMQSLRMTSELGANNGGHLYISFPAGHDLLYARFYVKFSNNCQPIHHFVHMGGYNPPTQWPQGGAGIRPDGTDRLTTGIEPFGASWGWDF